MCVVSKDFLGCGKLLAFEQWKKNLKEIALKDFDFVWIAYIWDS